MEDYSQLINKVFDGLDCKEEQTRTIIQKFLEDIKLFDRKQHDYGPQNIAKFGAMGGLVRSSDKGERLINLQNRAEAPEVEEPVTETWQDLTVYGAIARVCLDDNWKS